MHPTRGWRILTVCLEERRSSFSERATAFLGGRGANYEFLWEAHKLYKHADAAPMSWATGPLVGTGIPGASRINIASLSPITGGIGSSSAGTDFAECLRRCGVDQLCILGSSGLPVYLLITPGGTYIKDATPLWGLQTTRAVLSLRAIEGEEARVAVIGPAGENCVHASAIIFDGVRAAARCGLAAVMGRKHLKAIVVAGTRPTPQPLSGGIRRVAVAMASSMGRSPQLARIRDYGTASLAPGLAEPVRNHQGGRLSRGDRERLHMPGHSDFAVRSYGCSGCPIRCGKAYASNRILAGYPVRAPSLHANSITDFGSRLGVSSADFVVAAHGLCTELGLDIDNASSAVAWILESIDRRVLEPSPAHRDLSWGSEQHLLGLLEDVAYRRGLGKLVACGTDAAARAVGEGSEEWSITVKGQSLQEAVRPFKGWALGIMVSERGGTHTRGAPVTELSGLVPSGVCRRAGLLDGDLPCSTYDGKAQLVVHTERLHAVLDSLGLCYFISDWMGEHLPGFEMLSRAANTIPGVRMDPEALAVHGERIHTMGRLLNSVWAGFGRSHDYPPRRLAEPLETGECLRRGDWDDLLDEYYTLHGWDKRTGLPTADAISDVGLDPLKIGNSNGSDAAGSASG